MCPVLSSCGDMQVPPAQWHVSVMFTDPTRDFSQSLLNQSCNKFCDKLISEMSANFNLSAINYWYTPAFNKRQITAWKIYTRNLLNPCFGFITICIPYNCLHSLDSTVKGISVPGTRWCALSPLSTCTFSLSSGRHVPVQHLCWRHEKQGFDHWCWWCIWSRGVLSYASCWDAIRLG